MNHCRGPSVDTLKKYRYSTCYAPSVKIYRGHVKTIELRINFKLAEVSMRNHKVLREIVSSYLFCLDNKLLIDLKIIRAEFNSRINYGRTDERLVLVTYQPFWSKLLGTSNRKIKHHNYVTFNNTYTVNCKTCDCVKDISKPHITGHILHLLKSPCFEFEQR